MRRCAHMPAQRHMRVRAHTRSCARTLSLSHTIEWLVARLVDGWPTPRSAHGCAHMCIYIPVQGRNGGSLVLVCA